MTRFCMRAEALEVLGVPADAAPAAIHAAYIHRVRLIHPDRAYDDEDRVWRTAATVALNRAYAELRSETMRASPQDPPPRGARPPTPCRSKVSPVWHPTLGEAPTLIAAALVMVVAAIITQIVTGDGAVSAGMSTLAVMCYERVPRESRRARRGCSQRR